MSLSNLLDGLLFAAVLAAAVFGIASAIRIKDVSGVATMAVFAVLVVAQAAQIHYLRASLSKSQDVAIEALEAQLLMLKQQNKDTP